MSEQEVQEVVIDGTRDGLGIRIVGGKTDGESEFGIFVKEVIKNSLAARDGRLKRGDQLIEANGNNLIGVSNERAVSILQMCAKTNSIKLLISRGAQSRAEFNRLSSSLLLQPIDTTKSKKGGGGPQLNAPVATSTPRSTETQGAAQGAPLGMRASAVSEGTGATNTRPSSASSNLTQVSQMSTTDMETDDDIDKPLVGSRDHPRPDSGESPPPIPTSLPPMFDDEPLLQKARYHSEQDTAQRARTTPEGKAMSPPLSATLRAPSHVSTHSFVIPKSNGLGIVISGGINRQDGPHIFIDNILDGMDASRDGQLKKGDRILSVNGIDFSNMTREKALTTLTQLKIRKHVKAFTIAVERAVTSDGNRFSSGPLSSLPQPTHSIDSSIFDSSTIRASELKPPDSVISTPSAPDVYYQREASQTGSSSLLSHRQAEIKREDPAKKSTPQRYKKDGGKLDSLHKRLSMDPSASVKLSKLEWALSYMGYMITHQQQEQVRASLNISEDGRVVFAEFVDLAKKLFAFKLDDAHLEASLVYALTQKDSLEMPQLPKKATSVDHLAMELNTVPYPLKLASSHPHLLETSSDQQLNQMRQQLHEIGDRREKLKHSDTSGISELNKQREYEKHGSQHSVNMLPKKIPMYETNFNQEISSVSSEEANAVLKRKAGLAEAAAMASREKANHLEDTIREMQAELSVLREQHEDKSAHDLRTHLAAMDCELRKEKAATRRYQVATERLLQFVENCHEALVKSPAADKIMYHPHGQGQSVARGDAVTGNPRPPQYLSRHAKYTATTLAQEAKETISAVQKLLQAETLPFGWDFAYTEEGKKYYMNHETKTTSWVHPVTKVNASHGTRASTPSSQSSYRSNPP